MDNFKTKFNFYLSDIFLGGIFSYAAYYFYFLEKNQIAGFAFGILTIYQIIILYFKNVFECYREYVTYLKLNMTENKNSKHE